MHQKPRLPDDETRSSCSDTQSYSDRERRSSQHSPRMCTAQLGAEDADKADMTQEKSERPTTTTQSVPTPPPKEINDGWIDEDELGAV